MMRIHIFILSYYIRFDKSYSHFLSAIIIVKKAHKTAKPLQQHLIPFIAILCSAKYSRNGSHRAIRHMKRGRRKTTVLQQAPLLDRDILFDASVRLPKSVFPACPSFFDRTINGSYAFTYQTISSSGSMIGSAGVSPPSRWELRSSGLDRITSLSVKRSKESSGRKYSFFFISRPLAFFSISLTWLSCRRFLLQKAAQGPDRRCPCSKRKPSC